MAMAYLSTQMGDRYYPHQNSRREPLHNAVRRGYSQVTFLFFPNTKLILLACREFERQCWPHQVGGKECHMGKVYCQVAFPHIPKGKLILLSCRKFGSLHWQHRFGGDDVCGGCRKTFAYE